MKMKKKVKSMKKIVLFVSMLAMILGFVACSNEDNIVEQSAKSEKITILANTNADTRTTLNSENEVVWAENDIIQIGSIVDKKFTNFDIISGAGSTSGEFSGTQPAAGTYDVLYGITGNELVFPGIQRYASDNKVSNTPMYATVTISGGVASTINFKNLCGILWLKIKHGSAEANISSIRIEATESMVGDFSISAADGIPTVTLSSGNNINNFVVLDCTNGTQGVALDATTGTDFYIVMPPKTYNNVKIVMTDVNGKVFEKTLKNNHSLEIRRAGITQVSFTAGSFMTRVASATEYLGHQYVDLGLKSGTKWAKANVGAVDNAGNEVVTGKGNYYAWGELETKSSYTANSYQLSNLSLNDFTTTVTTTGNTATTLKPLYDIATVTWGGSWRMPTPADMQELIENCLWVWGPTSEIPDYKVNGWIVFMKKYDDKGDLQPIFTTSWSGRKTYNYTIKDTHIFLPSTQYKGQFGLEAQVAYGYYWTNTINQQNNAQAGYLRFDSNPNNRTASENLSRYYGLVVRPVFK